MLCHGCGSDEHLFNSGKCTKNFVRQKLSEGTSAVHVLHEVIENMERSEDDNSEEGIDNSQVSSELAEFDSLQDSCTRDHEDGYAIEALDQSSATNFIDSVMRTDDAVPTLFVTESPMRDFRLGRRM